MEFDLATAKLVSLFTTVNLVASSVGALAAKIFGPLLGLAATIVMIFLLPIPVQYLFLKRKNGNIPG